MSEELRDAIAHAIHRYDHTNGLSGNDIPSKHHRGEADIALAAIQSAYVPPPPGSDRDKLPDHLLAAIAPYMRPYLSTACETAQACHIAAARDLGLHDELRDWGRREHSACRLRRKQDVADCACRCHQEAGRGG